MKKILLMALLLSLTLTSCTSKNTPSAPDGGEAVTENAFENIVEIILSDDEIKIPGDVTDAVYVANDIVYYEDGKDFTYGEGSDKDAHSIESAAEHRVVHITKPGKYSVSGTISKGQIAIDLGEDAKENPDAVVTLILNGVDITCDVAPAVMFYNVYECADKDKPSKDVDTSKAGANVIIADGTKNIVNGSYVARIYKPDTVVLNSDGTEVEDAKKLHKYDAAFYSKMTMNVNGGEENTGTLTINAENEGLDSEMHLTVNGGIISINSGNDGINTNEDGVSVTTVNGGELYIKVTGETGEGDGIDSNGWLVINGGTVIAQACSFSADSGIDSDMGIHVNGGLVIATGSMLDRIEGTQKYLTFSMSQKQKGGSPITLKNENGEAVIDFTPANDFSMVVFSSPELTDEAYTIWSGDVQLDTRSGMGMGGRPGGSDGKFPEGKPSFDGNMPPSDGNMPPFDGSFPEGMTPPEGMPSFDGNFPEGFEMPEGFSPDMERGKKPIQGDFSEGKA